MKSAAVMMAGALALGLLAAPASAQDYAPDRVKKSVEIADLAAVVGSLGHQVIEEGEGEDVLVIGEDPDQIKYILLGTACNLEGVAGCQGVLMQVQFDLPAGTTPETLAKANLEYAALNVWANFEDKTLGFTRYVVLDQGVTMANLRANIEVLLSLVANAYPVAAGEDPVAETPAGA